MSEIKEENRPWPDGGPRGTPGTVNCAVPVEPDPESEDEEESA